MERTVGVRKGSHMGRFSFCKACLLYTGCFLGLPKNLSSSFKPRLVSSLQINCGVIHQAADREFSGCSREDVSNFPAVTVQDFLVVFVDPQRYSVLLAKLEVLSRVLEMCFN